MRQRIKPRHIVKGDDGGPLLFSIEAREEDAGLLVAIGCKPPERVMIEMHEKLAELRDQLDRLDDSEMPEGFRELADVALSSEEGIGAMLNEADLWTSPLDPILLSYN